MCHTFIQPSSVERTVLHPMEVADMHEVCLRFSSRYSLSSGIQTDTEIIAVTGILIITRHTIGSNTMYLGIGGLGEAASLKMGKMLNVAAMHPV